MPILPDFGEGFRLALAWTVFGIFAALASRYIFYLYTEKLLDGGEALAAFLAVAAYAAQIVSRWDSVWGPLLLVVAVVAVPLAYLAHRRTVQRAMQRMMREDALGWERTARKDPRNAAAHYFLGELYLQAGAYQAALQAFERAVALSPQDGAHRAGLEKARRRHEQKHRMRASAPLASEEPWSGRRCESSPSPCLAGCPLPWLAP